ncbi:hybrid sensor histidine kinase/response regulator [Geobacter benzoatilyticus]|uniref:histidine kinase n=1 Tax=Geobacter benzoatilyticus TaxID=2815309 RepID=A0ABX7Q7C7_9BACT|nr:PAS domain-containing sensor histidine kinase [Geobacter benzoatilyticus]QSV46943.1 PAS domain S-box protein [Geobacter benzoatilyticus]
MTFSLDNPQKNKQDILDSVGILTAIRDAISVQDLNLRILYQNPAHKQLMGDHAGEYCYAAYQHKDKACEGCHLLRSFRDGLSHQRETSVVIDNEVHYVEITSSPLRDADGAIVGGIESVRDITEREKNREELNYVSECFRQALNDSQHILYRLNVKKGCYDYIGPAFEKITGYRLAEFRKTSLEQLPEYFHPDDRQRIFGHIEETLRTRTGPAVSFDLEYRLRKADGSYCWLHDSNTACFDEHGELECFFGSALDITEQKRAEELLRQSEERLRSIINANPEPQFLIDRDGTIIMGNQSLAKRLGKSLDEVQGHNVAEFGPPDLHECRMMQVEEVFRSGKPQVFTDSRAGLELENHFYPIFDQEGMVSQLAILSIDISERNMLQQQLLRTQKLESLGVLAGGIAHDFNNILTGVMGNISFAKMFLNDTHEAYGSLENAEKASKRAAELVKKLLIFAKGGQPVKKPVFVQNIIQSAMALFLSGTAVKGSVDMPHALPAVDGDEIQLCQAFDNIIVNAVQAMPAGGNLTVSGATVVLPAENSVGLSAGEYVKITFRDEGSGITEADQKKIFDPYFSTKASGLGLGLASTHAIIAKHDGQITVESAIGVGTAFTLYLPVTASTSVEHRRETGGVAGKPGRRVLVMDDDEMVRDFATMALERLGHVVATCGNGGEAIASYRAAKEAGTPFSVVIMDLTIPGGMGGAETARRIRDFDPDALLVVSSGYSDDPVMANYREYGFCAALEKPYTAAKIAEIFAGFDS